MKEATVVRGYGSSSRDDDKGRSDDRGRSDERSYLAYYGNVDDEASESTNTFSRSAGTNGSNLRKRLLQDNVSNRGSDGSSDSYGSATQYKRGQEGYSGGYSNYQGGGYGEQGGKAKSKSKAEAATSKSKAAITSQNKAATKLKRYKSEQSSYEIEIASFSWRSNHDKERARNLHIRIWRLRHNT